MANGAVAKRSLANCSLVECGRMLTLRCSRQPPRTRNALFVYQALEYILGYDEEVFDGAEARVFFCGAAVDVGTAVGIVLNDGGGDLARMCGGVGDDVEGAGRAVDGTGVGEDGGFCCGEGVGAGGWGVDVRVGVRAVVAMA